jgi:hypothetical protein
VLTAALSGSTPPPPPLPAPRFEPPPKLLRRLTPTRSAGGVCEMFMKQNKFNKIIVKQIIVINVKNFIFLKIFMCHLKRIKKMHF